MNDRIVVRIALFSAVLVSISICFPQTRQAGQRPAAPTRAPFLQQAKSYEETTYVTKVVLKNGMKVLVNEYRSQPVVSIQAYVHAGLSDEPSQSPGLAGLLAAMVYRGAADRSMGTFRQNAQALGGFFKSSTDYAYTKFEIIAPSSQWKRALDMQAEALLNPWLDPDELKLEADLVADGARGALDDPSEYAHEKLLELGFNQPRMGEYDTMASGALRGITREDLAAFHKAMYRPAELMLVVSGDINSSDVLNEVVRVYDKPAGTAGKRAPLSLATAQNDFRYRGLQGNTTIPRVLMGFHTVPGNADDSRAVEVLSAILGSGEGSVLTSRLRDQKGLILAAETKLTAGPDFGYLSIDMEVDPKNIDRSEIAALTEMELLKREEPSEADMERALAQLEHSYWKRLEAVTGRARNLAYFELLGDWKRMDRYVSELRRVDPSDVKRAANRYLRLQNCSLLEYLPVSGEKRNFTAEGIRNTLADLLSPSAKQEQMEREKEVALALKVPPAAESFKFSEIRYPFQLASILRGPDMFIREDHTAPLIELGLYFPGGKLAEKGENSGITELMVNLMLEGTKNQDAVQFHRQLEIYGAQVLPVVADDYFGFNLSILSRNFESGFGLLQEAIKTPDFSKDAIRRCKEIQSAKILSLKNSESYPRQLVNQALFKDFSYSLDRNGTEASLAAITEESLQGWYEAYVKNRKPIVTAIGDSKGTSLAGYFVKSFSGSRIQEAKIPEEFTKPVERGESLEQSWNRSQSLILVGFQAPSEDDEDGYAARVLQSYAGDTGRFAQELRDRLGVAYRVSVIYEPRLRGGSMIVWVASSPGREEAALKSIREEIRRITSDPITYRDLRSALNAAFGAQGIRNQARFAQIAEIVENIMAGKGIEGFQTLVNSLQEVGESDLKEVARRIFAMDKAIILRMHGQSQ